MRKLNYAVFFLMLMGSVRSDVPHWKKDLTELAKISYVVGYKVAVLEIYQKGKGICDTCTSFSKQDFKDFLWEVLHTDTAEINKFADNFANRRGVK